MARRHFMQQAKSYTPASDAIAKPDPSKLLQNWQGGAVFRIGTVASILAKLFGWMPSLKLGMSLVLANYDVLRHSRRGTRRVHILSPHRIVPSDDALYPGEELRMVVPEKHATVTRPERIHPALFAAQLPGHLRSADQAERELGAFIGHAVRYITGFGGPGSRFRTELFRHKGAHGEAAY